MKPKDLWVPPPEPDFKAPRGFEWVRILARLIPLTTLIFGALALMLLLRFLERPLFGIRRPITPFITRFVCRNALRIIGIGYSQQGTPMQQPGAMVANHASWLDIFVLNAGARMYFVSKSEVAGWPVIGWLARATGTVFIRRQRAEAKRQAQTFENRLKAGHNLLFFPEGTSTDSLRVLPFKSTLFEAFFTRNIVSILSIQPVSVLYISPDDTPQSFYGWWGDMDFASHFLEVIKTKKQGHVLVTYHPPLKVSDFENRKALAAAAEDAVRGGFRI